MTGIRAAAGTAAGRPLLDPAGLRRAVGQACGFDPGPLTPETPLDRAGLHGLARLQIVWWLEATLDVDFPADLVTAVETVDDLCHYATVKVDQQRSAAVRVGATP